MILAILQARLSSSRLPGKVLKPIMGKPMLAYQLERLARCKKIDQLIVATSDHPEDQAIADLCNELNVPCFHGPLEDVLARFYLAAENYKIILTTDHGCIRASKPVKIIGDRNTNTNLRYKLGKNLAYDAKEIFTVKEPDKAQLPSPNISTSYIFATGNNFFAYPNNYNYYVSYYKDTFQHGGVSMEEMLIPLITLQPKKR